VYDKSVPPAEAVRLFDDFLVKLANRRLQVFVISGNHDSPERIAFGGRLMDASGIHLSPVYDGNIRPISMNDRFGQVNFYMLPFVKPASVRPFFLEEEISSYTDALRAAVAHMNVDTAKRNVLVTHQFVTGAERSDSEDISVGGTDNVDAAVFAPFDYVALGHIHGPQYVGCERIRYCGTPLKYSFSEKDHIKSVTVVEMKEKGNIAISTVPLKPRHDLREIKGTYDELTLKANYEHTAADDYLHVILTDEEDVPDAMARLRTIYPNLMKLDYDNTRTRSAAYIAGAEDVERKTEIELFAEFYEKQNGQPMSEDQKQFSLELLEKIKEAAL
jgi:exonuclease SbcD